jgi:hypothetical protein
MYPVVVGIALIVAGLAAASLLLPWEPVYDPWGWLVWGREAAALELDTTGGPSWKPLPVLFTILFSVVPEAAPELWLLVARAGWLASVAAGGLLAYRVAARLDGGREARIAAALIGGLALVLLTDTFTPWLRQFAGGLSEPLLTAFALLAVERALAGRHGAALALATGAALIRPEAWPFLAAYGLWLWRDGWGQTPVGITRGRRGVVVAFVTVPLLWFVPDLLASGSIFTGADRAREGSGSPPIEALEVFGRAALLPLAVLWAGFAYTVWRAREAQDRHLVFAAAGALAWIALVAVMAAGGYAGLPRFMAPAAGVVCALGAAGLAVLAPRRPALVSVLALALAVQTGFRVADMADAARYATTLGEAQRELADLAEDPAARECRPVAVGAIEGQTALAWWLETPIGEIDVSRTPPRAGVHFVRTDTGWRVEDTGELGCPNFG